jgi:hypothetical protein
MSTGGLILRSLTSDADIILQGTDGSSSVNALTLDMSAAGAATFNAGLTLGGNLTMSNASSPSINLTDTTNNVNLVLYSQNSNSHIGTTSNHSLVIDVNNSAVLTLDSSNNATFAGKVDTGAGLRLFTDGSNNGVIQTLGPDKDMFFSGDDGGSGINALVLDMSAAGTATFNKDILLSDNSAARFGTGQDLALFHDGTNSNIRNTTGNLILDATVNIVLDADGDNVVFSYGGDGEVGRLGNSSQNFIIHSLVSNKDMLFNGIDDGSAFTALTLDMSAAGNATFNAGAVFGGGITVAGIGGLSNVANDLTIFSSASGHNGLRFHDNGILPTNNAGAIVDADADLGIESHRFKDLFLSGGIRNVNGDGFNAGTEGGEPILIPADNSGALNGQGLLGHPSFRWKDLYLSGGAFIGGTGDANKLDDYEEGTWTPVVHGSGAGAYTYSGVTSRYTKIGNLVTLTCQLTNITTSGSGHAGYLQIRNAPFNKIGDTFPVGSVELSSVDMSSGTSFATVQFITSGSTNTLYIRQHGDNSEGADLPITAINSGTSDITINIQYTA